VPLAGGARQKALPHARRRTGIRRANGKPERTQARPVHRDAIAERRQVQALLGEARKLLEEPALFWPYPLVLRLKSALSKAGDFRKCFARVTPFRSQSKATWWASG
jgi:hypothetical protein